MKTRRSDRLIDMTRYLLERPHTLISLTFFSERYESAKSSISEDLAIIKRTFKLRGIRERQEEQDSSRPFRKKRHVHLSAT